MAKKQQHKRAETEPSADGQNAAEPAAERPDAAGQAAEGQEAAEPGTEGQDAAEPGIGKLETTLAELEALVERLETGDLPLEQALGEFERGMKLTRECQGVLKDAEQKVEILLGNDENAEPTPFEPEADPEED